MNSIVEYFKQSELALAAYANLIPGVDPVPALQDSSVGMSSAQASAFATKWNVVKQSTDPTTGVSATVFQAVSGGPKYLAIRGTQGLTDYLADYLILNGTPSTLNPQYQALKAQVQAWLGDGTLTPGFTVSGHSLGGYLAAGLVADFGSSISHAYLYNAPGNNSLISQVSQALGFSSTPDASKITSLRADAGISPIAALGNDFSPPISIAIENQFLSDVPSPPGAFNHSQRVLTDALAVYALFSELAPTLSVGDMTALLKASSNQNVTTLESAAYALAKLFMPGTSTIAAENREALYATLQTLQQNTLFKQDAGLVQVKLLGASVSSTVSGAQTDIAYRYALSALNPFAITGDSALYGVHNTGGQLDLYDETTGTGSLTKLYLQDRAAMLGWLNKTYTEDTDIGRVYDGNAWYFKDEASGKDVWVGNPISVKSDPLLRTVLFGQSVSDILTGGGSADHIYGGGGDDIVKGADGNDYLEGGLGSDDLQGGAGRDTLHGGQGADVLEGGKDNDTLNGGAGYDLYIINAGDGTDTILDSDGQGQIKLGGLVAQGGATAGLDPAKWRQSGNVWQDQQNGITYGLVTLADGSQTLFITGLAGSTVEVRGWTPGKLGIALGAGAQQSAVAAPATHLTIAGDLEPLDTDPTTAGIQEGYDALDNLKVTGVADPDREDTLYDSVGNDHLLGLGGNDTLIAWRGGDDVLEGGAGQDYLSGGAGNDTLVGGDDSDVLLGGADNDQLFAQDQTNDLAAAILASETQPGTGARGDWLSGDDGNDILVGGAGNDVLLGGEGEDLLIGGGGNDNIYGDQQGAANIDWVLTRTITVVDSSVSYRTDITNGTTVEAAVGGADVIYGGAGDDWIEGGQGNDFIDAGADNDVVFGGAGSDVILGGSGNDVLIGNAGFQVQHADGGDFIDGGAGDDEIWGGGGNDILLGGDGDDVVYGDGNGTFPEDDGDDYIDGGTGNDTLYGGGGNDILLGGTGIDYLYGEAGHDTLDGGEGADYLDGGAGNDTYLNVTDEDTVYDLEGTNTIKLVANGLGAGGLSTSLQNDPDGNPYVQLSVALDTGGDLKLDSPFFANGTTALVFADGTTLDLETLVSTSLITPLSLRLGDDGGRLYGGAGDDVLLGGAGDDILIGYGGNDILQGGAGNDTYLGVSGSDRILDNQGDNSVFLEASGLGAGGLSASIQSNQDGTRYMQLQIALDNGDLVKFDSPFFADGTTTLQFAGGDTLDLETLIGTSLTMPLSLALGGAGGKLHGGAGDDILTGGAGDDILVGHKGNDLMRGRAGDDTYLLAKGGGLDRILDYDATADNVDVVRFLDVASTEVTALRRNGNDLVLRYGASERLTVREYFNAGLPGYKIEEFQFSDGVVWTDPVAQYQQSQLAAAQTPPGGGAATPYTLNSFIVNGLFNSGISGILIPGFPFSGLAGVNWSGISVPGLFGLLNSTLWTPGIPANGISDLYNAALRPRPISSDPLVLDLDGWGIQTVSADRGILFDHDGDGVKHGSGWVREGDGFLVLDRNGNGFIDNGTELFGVDYLKQDGSKASDGFDALRDLDSNADGVFDSNDAEYANVRVWRDLNQDGVSQADELKTLAEHNIASIGLNPAVVSTNLWDGNRLTHVASFTRTDGTIGTAANLILGANTFFREHGDSVPLADEAYALPNMRGAGAVRDLREAAAGSIDLRAALTAYVAAPTRAAQQSLLGSVMEAWAASAGVMGSVDLAAQQDLTLVYLMPGQSIPDYEAANGIGVAGDTFDALSAEQQTRILNLEAQRLLLVERITLLETFNGQRFVEITPDNRVFTGTGAAVSVIARATQEGGDTVNQRFAHVSINSAQAVLLDRSYSALTQSVYDSLATQTRLKPYLEAITLTLTDAGNIALDFSGVQTHYDAQKSTDPRNALIDLIELHRYVGSALTGLGFNAIEVGLADLAGWRSDPEINTLLAAANVRFDDSADGVARGGYFTNDTLIAREAGSTLHASNGNDALFGSVGVDYLDGGSGDDLLVGGGGDDMLVGGEGNDTYRFGRGFNRDVAIERASHVSQGNRVVFNADVAPDDVVVRKIGSDLTLSIKGTADQLTLRNAAAYAAGSSFGSVEFADGTVWDYEALKNLAVAGTDGDDFIEGFDGRTEIFDGGAGDDVINGGTGADIYRFGRGDGQDVVQDFDWQASNIDALEFKAGVLPTDVLLTRDGQNLVARIPDSGDQVTLKDWFDGYANRIERIRFADGTSWDVNTMRALVGITSDDLYLFGTSESDTLNGGASDNFIFGQEGGDLLYGGDGNDSLDGGDGDDVLQGGAGSDTLYGGLGADVLNGGAGDDVLYGNAEYAYEAGGDVYEVETGGGFDTVFSGPAYNNVDTLRFGAGITPSDLRVQFAEMGGEDGGYGGYGGYGGEDYDLPAAFAVIGDGEGGGNGTPSGFKLAIGTGANEGALIVVDDPSMQYYANDYFGVQRFVFDDGTELSLQDILAMADGGVIGEQYGTEGDDSWLFGSVANDTIHGLGGNDRIEARDNEDLVFGGNGDDAISAGTGDDEVYGDDGDDVIAGGHGNDFLDGGNGRDVYVFNRGDGDDHLAASDGDTISFGVGVLPEDIFVFRNADGDLVLRLNDGAEGTMTVYGGLPLTTDDVPGLPIQRVQFIDADGHARVFDFAGALGDQVAGLGASDAQNPVQLLAGSSFEITGLETVAGGDYAVAYAQTGDLFGTPYYATLRFEAGVEPGSISLSHENGSYVLNYGDSGNSIRLDFDSSTAPFNTLVFADGSSLSYEALTAGGLDITGTPDVDSLTGTTDSDRINGLAGNDILSGGGGFDTYTVGADGGVVTIIDQATPGEENLLIFSGPVFNLDQIRLVTNGQPGFLSVEVAGETRAVKLSGFDPAHALTASAIGFFQVGDGGPVHTYAELAANGFNVVGTADDDVLQGTFAFDHMFGGTGNDHLRGGPGDDIAEGGAGDDHYYYNRGDGLLTIRDEISLAPRNSLHFGPGITLEDIRNNLRFEMPVDGSPGALIVNVDADGNGVRIEGFDPGNAETGAHAVENFAFANGMVLSYAELVRNTFVIQGDGANNVLTGTNISDRLYGFGGADTLMGGAGSDTLTGGEGADLLQGGDGDDVYVFNRGDGLDTILDSGEDNLNSILFGPGILLGDVSYDWEGSTLVLNYGPGDAVRIPDFYLAGDNGSPVVRLIEFDDGMVVSMADLLNRAPLVGDAISAPAAIEDSEYLFTVPAGAFTDPDAGDRLSLVAQLADGNPLPSWLNFDPSTGVFSGTPDNAHVGSLDITLEASDYFGLSATQSFRIEVLNVNDAPIVVTLLPALTLLEDEAFSYTLPENTFLDVDAGDSLSYSATLTDGGALPSWLSFDAATRTFNGTPGNAEVGSLAISVTATDLAGASAATAFDLSVLNVNDAPVVSAPIQDQSAKEGQAYQYTLPANTFTDPDVGDSLSYEVSLDNGDPLPAWLSFDATTLTFAGTPGGGDVGSFSVKVTASDLAGAQVADSFTFSVSPGYNEINGTAGWDFLIGTAGNDRVDGKASADFMAGLGGDDLYIVDNPWDRVLEFAGGGVDTVEASVSYQLPWHVENLTLTGNNASNGTGNTLNNVLIGNSAVNSLIGAAGNDTLDGLGGHDTLTGGTGNDTYRLGRGYGLDTVVENDSTAGNTDIAQFLSGVAADQIWFQKVGNNLETSIIGTSDKLVVKDWYLGSARHIEQFKTTDGIKTLLNSQVDNLVNAMASFAPPAAGQTTLPQNYQEALAGVIAANWQ